jgi:hypothetical protein
LTTSTVPVSKRTFSVNAELFEISGINTYELMIGIILSSFTNDPIPPNVDEIAQLGRMNTKQTTAALQGLLEKGILPDKVFRRILGEYGDPRLSWAAKGLLSYLKNNPQIDLSELAEKSIDDETSVRYELEELKRYGYLDEALESMTDRA